MLKTTVSLGTIPNTTIIMINIGTFKTNNKIVHVYILAALTTSESCSSLLGQLGVLPIPDGRVSAASFLYEYYFMKINK